MSLEKRKLSTWIQPISSLDDRPKLTAIELKSAFDANTNQLKPAINGVIDDLIWNKGASEIGFQSIPGVDAQNIQQAIEKLAEEFSKLDPTVDIPLAISYGGTSAKTNIDAIYTLGAKPRKNLLDNWCFINPINQNEIYDNVISTGKYILDRYLLLYEDGAQPSYNRLNHYLDFNNENGTGNLFMEQRFEPGKFKIGTTYNFTFLCKSGLYSGNIMPGTLDNDKRIYLNNNLLNVAIIKNEFYDSVIIGIKEGHREYLLALKLEEGNTQSLARKTTTGWELLEEPDYLYELIKCQRY